MANINKNIIMQAGAAVANVANKAAGLPAATPEPGSIISVIQLVNGGRTIGPDALAHFTESVRNKLLSLLVIMEPIQDFNGYGHPWPGGGGKNLFGIDEYLAAAGATYTKNEDTYTITVNNALFNIPFVFSDTDIDVTLSLSSFANGTTTNARIEILNSSNEIIASLYADSDEKTKTVNGSKLRLNWSSSGSLTISKPQIELGSTATSFAPYSNICPISGRTGLSVYVGPTSAIGDAATYSMNWTSPAGIVYAGSADIVSGDIKAAPYYASYNGETLVGPWVSSMDEYDPEGTPTTGAQVVDLGGTMTEYHITGQDIITLVGDNYIWSDSGDVTITE